MTELIAWLHRPEVFIPEFGMVGLVIGSFLNVVIFRVPVMLCQADAHDRFNLAGPRSRCPECDHPIGAFEIIPVVSYLLLRGRCRCCGRRISMRYPVVEILGAVLAVACARHFGFSVTAVAAFTYSAVLVALAFIDWDTLLLPDMLTIPLLWLGLMLSTFHVFVSARDAVLGAMAGYLCLWGVHRLSLTVTGADGMGIGDAKLLAAIGAWCGPAMVLPVLFAGSLMGVAYFALGKVTGRTSRQEPFAFGPWLAVAGWFTLLWGHTLWQSFMAWSTIIC